ncbi:MAG: hypothetical protein WBB37_06550 [bacterium]
MEKKNFSNKEAIKYGWSIMKANLWYFVGILIVAWLVVGIPGALADHFQKNDMGFLALLFNIITSVLRVIISIGMIKIALKFLAKEKPEFIDLFGFQGNFWRFVGGSILYGLIVIAGFILLIVPGIYWAIKFQWFGYCIVDQKLGPVNALKKSAEMTQTVKWQLLGFAFVIAGINILGFLCLFIGLFATVPTTLMAYAFVYRKLVGQTESEPATAPALKEEKPA